MIRARLIALATVLSLGLGGCGGSSPVTPTPTPTPPITLTGHVIATNGGQPLTGLAVDFGGRPTVTDTSGSFLYQMPSGSTARLLLSGPGIVERSLLLNGTSSRDVTVAAIAVSGVDSFNLNFYRQLVRNTFEVPDKLEPLRRLLSAPQIYLKTVDEAGVAIDSRTLDSTERTVRETAALWTGAGLGSRAWSAA